MMDPRSHSRDFFEGMLLGLVRKLIPIFVVLSYINEYFQPKRLVERFGKSYIFKFGSTGGEPVVINAIFWYFASLLIIYLLWYLVQRGYGRYRKSTPIATEPASEQT